MQARSCDSSKSTSGAAPVQQARGVSNDVRLAAVVEAAYLLDARTR